MDVPPDADASAVRSRALGLDLLLDRMRVSGAGPFVVLLDACRAGPDGAMPRWAADAPGLAPASAGPAGLIAFAAQAGASADEGPPGEPYSRFTGALLDVLAADPGLPVDTMLKRVHESVVTASGGRQRPEYTDAAGTAPVRLAPPTGSTPCCGGVP